MSRRAPLLAAALVGALAGALAASPALARDSLGVFGTWAAFRDPGVPRCYAIARPESVRLEGLDDRLGQEYPPYADIGSWPGRAVRGAFHLRWPRKLDAGRAITLNVAGQRWPLAGGGADAWGADARADAAIVAALRGADSFSASAHDADGHAMVLSWKLEGAATAMDAATLACAH